METNEGARNKCLASHDLSPCPHALLSVCQLWSTDFDLYNRNLPMGSSSGYLTRCTSLYHGPDVNRHIITEGLSNAQISQSKFPRCIDKS